MRVSLDTNPLYTTQAGIARYLRGLLRGFELAQLDDLEIRQTAWETSNFDYRQPQRAIKTAYRELLWNRLKAPGMIRDFQPSVWHQTSGIPVRLPRGVQRVATLYDLALLRHPERFRKWQRLRGTRTLWQLKHGFEKIMCISRFSADEAMQLLGISSKKLEVVYCGGDFHPEEPEAKETKPSVEIPDEFFLFVGSLEPGKNLALLKQTYEQAKTQGKSLPPLVIVGARWAGVAGEGAPPEGWHYLGRQPDEVLVWLYRRSLALAFPSKYEGFGLPLVEAMALDCPVVCSRVASLPEVGGDAALYAELTPEDYLKSLRRLIDEEGLREDLVRKGREQAAKFSWSNCARETAAVYHAATKA